MIATRGAIKVNVPLFAQFSQRYLGCWSKHVNDCFLLGIILPFTGDVYDMLLRNDVADQPLW